MGLLSTIFLWLMCTVTGVFYLFLPRVRYRSAYFLLVPTTGILLSVAMSQMALLLLKTPINRWLVLFAYLGGLCIGGVIGFGIGIYAARRVNEFMGWQKK